MRLSNEPTPVRRPLQSKHRPITSRPTTVHITVRQVMRQVIDRNLQVKPIRLAVRGKPVGKLSLKVLRAHKLKISPHPSPVHPSQIRQRMLSVSHQPIRQTHRQIKIITHSPAIARNIIDRPTQPNPRPLNQRRRRLKHHLSQHHLSQHHLKQHNNHRRLKVRTPSHLASPHLVILPRASPQPVSPQPASLHLAVRHLVNRQALAHGLVHQIQKFLNLLPNLLPKRHHHPFRIRRPLADRAWI